MEIELKTAPADIRFPTTNQSRHCFTRYVEFHKCLAVKGEESGECDKFAKYYRSLCPGEWVDRWNEQRDNGTFPGVYCSTMRCCVTVNIVEPKKKVKCIIL